MNMTTNLSQFEKLSIALKYYLRGRGYTRALEALRFSKKKHDGLRKDKVTPEVQHQIEIALYITTLKDVRNEEVAICVALLHDVIEDTDTGFDEILNRFGPEVAKSVWLISKKVNGKPKYAAELADNSYYKDCADDVHASLVKGCDRIHNINSMGGVFDKEKQLRYVAEVEEHFLPMIRKAEGLFPDQLAAYLNVKHMLKSQMNLVRNGLTSP